MLHININREDTITLSQQICRSIKEDVLMGKIGAGEKLPSSRELSKALNVARNVVIQGYEQLIAEGYAYPERGSGTYISAGVALPRSESPACASIHIKSLKNRQNLISFRTGIPDLTTIPIKKWAQIYHKIALDVDPSQMDYQDPFGNNRLRVQLSRYLNRARGTNTSPENILITNGAAQCFNLLCQLVSSDEYALVENPLSYGILHTLESNNVKIRPICLDDCGMVISNLPQEPPKLIFTTPSHQFPTGAILPAARRIELINYAKSNDAYVVEDDYDSEFRFNGRPIQSMQYLAPDRVIYVGTFSKTLMPALRIGYMAMPDILCDRMREAKFVADIHSPVFEQLTLAELIESGIFELHIRRMQKLYYKKRNHLISCLKQTFGEKVSISGTEAGLLFVASFEEIRFDPNVLQELELAGIEIAAVKKNLLNAESYSQYDNALVFGYGNTKMENMATGIDIIASIIRKHGVHKNYCI